MNIAIVGSRDISAQTFAIVKAFARSVAFKGHKIITGGARGVDHAAILGSLSAGEAARVFLPVCIQHQPAEVRPHLIYCDIIQHPERNNSNFVQAIHQRNREIVRLADLAVVFHWDSPGSRSYIRYANKIGKPVKIFKIPRGGDLR